jgi:hypothetical protein
MRAWIVITVAVGVLGVALCVLWLHKPSKVDSSSIGPSLQEATPIPAKHDPRQPELTQTPSLDQPRSVQSPRIETATQAEQPAPIVATSVDVLGEFRRLPEQSMDEMKTKLAAEQHKLQELAGPHLEQRFTDNAVEHFSDGPNWTGGGTEKERSEIYWIRFTPGRGIEKALLPRWQFPELYALKDDTVRLQDRLTDAEVKASPNYKPQ